MEIVFMAVYVALLRGVNVGGNNLVGMSELKELCAKVGLGDVRSLLASGNLVFECGKRSCGKLELMLEAETLKRFGVGVDYVIRTGEEWGPIVRRNPFLKEAKKEPGRVVVMFFKKALVGKDVEGMKVVVKGREYFWGEGRELYVVYPDGMGRSKFSNTVIERKLGVRGTMRNWNTVLKLGEMAAGE
jgi:uncharacterized protein (DUF1697 family)